MESLRLHSQLALVSLHKIPERNRNVAVRSLSLCTYSLDSPLSIALSHIFRRPKLSKDMSFHILSSAQDQATLEIPQSVTENDEEQLIGEEDEDEASRTRILAQNVPWSSTADDIRTLFKKYGTVVDIELPMHSKTRSRGLAFVTMGSHEEALAALSNLESYEYEGRALKLNWARPKKKPSSPRQPKQTPIHNVFVGNLSFQASANDLQAFFDANNTNAVTAHVIFQNNPRKSAGYGFVSFNTKKDADTAISALQGKELMGRPIQVAPSKKFLRRETEENIQSAENSERNA